MTTPEHLPAPIVNEVEAVETELAALDLSIGVFHEAARAGEEAAASVTVAHPVTAAGLMRWIDTVGSARTSLVGAAVGGEEARWEIENPENRPVVRHRTVPERSVSFIAGNASTGTAAQFPNVARKRGPATTRAFAQLTLPLGIDSPEQSDPWIFLYYRASDEVRMELSQPTAFAEGIVEDWRKRIILPPLDLSAVDVPPADVNSTDVDFTISPRGI